MDSAQLSIRRHHVRIRATGRPPAASAVVAEVARRLEETPAPHGTGYWVIRSLEVTAVVGAEWSASRVATAVARGVLSGLTERVRNGPDPDGALWFPDRAAFLGAFLVDLAAGRARGRWEYGQFEQAGVDAGDAIAGLADDEPVVTLTALLRLSDRELEQVVAAIGPARVDEVAARLARPAPRADPGTIAGIVADRLLRGRMLGDARDGLLVALIAARDGHGADVAGVAAVAATAVAVAQAAERARSRRDALLAAIAAGEWRVVRTIVGASQFDPLLALVSWTPEDRRELVAALAPGSPSADPDTAHTPFGGFFLLLPLLDELWDWQAATRGWPVVRGVAAATALRLQTVASALSSEARRRISHDGLLRRALGIDLLIGDEAFADALSHVTPAQRAAFTRVAGVALPPRADAAIAPADASAGDRLAARCGTALLRALGGRLPGMAGASVDHLRRDVLDIEAHVRFESERAVVELSPPPLGVVVSLSGLDRGSFRMPESEDLTWMLSTRG
jgi:hypothetical protein